MHGGMHSKIGMKWSGVEWSRDEMRLDLLNANNSERK
jgi:hypothetical protein